LRLFGALLLALGLLGSSQIFVALTQFHHGAPLLAEWRRTVCEGRKSGFYI
jgi:hypothetical protein